MGNGSNRSSKVRFDASALTRAAGHADSMMETLEKRVLLGGDHPSFMLPLDVDNSTAITLDGDGSGTDTGMIDPAGDDDLFSFTAPADDFVRVWADTINTADPSMLDSRVEVYDADGMLVAEGSSQGALTAGTFDDGWAGFVAEAGETYFVRIMSDDTMGEGATGGYIVRVDAISQTITLETDDTLPTFGTGTLDGLISIVGHDEVINVTTTDVAGFDSLATFGANLQVDGFGVPINSFDTRLDIFDASGMRIAFDSQTGRLTNAFTTTRSDTETTFFIRLRSDEFAVGEPEATGAFTLDVDMAATPMPIDPVTRIGKFRMQGPIGGDTTNVWGFQSEGTGLHFVTVVGDPIPPFIPPQPDVAVRVYRDDGSLAGFNDDFAGNQAQIEIQLVGGEQYWIVIEAFDESILGGYALTVDAHHTFDPNSGVDDHIDAPGVLEDEEDPQVILDTYRELEQATPLVFNDPFQNIDQFNNTLRDYGYQQTAFATGRIHEGGDSDLFQFVLPVDHLGEYEGDNDDAGIALYLGGSFENVDTDYENQRVSVWDGEDFFAAGQHFLDGSVRALRAWDGDAGGPAPAWLFAGGDFTALDDADINPFGPSAVGGIAYFDPTQGGVNDAGGWNAVTPLDGFDGPIYAMEVFDHDDDGVPSLFVGGDFTMVDGVAAENLVRIDMLSWNPLLGPTFAYAPVADTPGPVYALKSWLIEEESWDDGDYNIEFEEAPGEGFDGMDGVDLLPRLIVGGEFGALMSDGLSYTDTDLTTGFNDAVYGGAGIVYAIESYDPPDIEGPGGTVTTEPELIIAGDFTDVDGLPSANIVRWVTAEIPDPPPDTPAWSFTWTAAGTGTDDVVRALHVWDSEGTFTEEPALILGGDFTAPGASIAAWTGMGFVPMGTGFNGPVHSIETIRDEDYISTTGAIVTRPQLYVGGAYSTADDLPANNLARYTMNPLGIYAWEGMAGGTDNTVFALQGYDDDSENRWDRHDRPASRIGIVVAPEAAESFANAFIRIYDSNFEIVMEQGTNDTIAPPFPDPAGKINLALTTAEAFDLDDDNFSAPPMWAGETYYLEVITVGGTGRYSVALTSDALPPETDGDGIFDNIHSTPTEIADAGNWAAAQTREITYAGGPNDTDNGLGSASFPYPGFHNEVFTITPSGRLIVNSGDYGVIETPGDSDLYFFRAPTDGIIEVRTVTFGIQDQFAEQVVNLLNGSADVNTRVRDAELPLRSRLDTKITVYNNDFVEIGASDDIAAISADITESYFATLGERTYRPTDSRSVVEVVGGEGYFVLVESGQRQAYEDGVVSGDLSRVDWRAATGSYELLINAGPELDFDDDHSNLIALGWGTPIPIDDLTGAGSITGEIDNTFANPDDFDVFEYIAVYEGEVTVTIERLSGDLEVDIDVLEQQDFTVVTSGSAGPSGSLEVTFNARKGERFTFDVFSSSGLEGEYVINVQGAGFVDDHASEPKWTEASELVVLDFNGTASATGSIDFAGDTDVFFFTPTTYDLATIELTAVSPFFDPLVRIYEVGVDPVGNPKLRQIAFDDNSAAGLNAITQFSITAPERDTFIDDPATIAYNSYLVLVQGADRDRDFGDYALELSVTQTDDHPDIDQFQFATPIVVVPASGDGEDTGEIEKTGDTDLFRFIAPAGGPTDVLISREQGGDFNPTVQIIEVDAEGNQTILASQADSDSGANGNVLVSFTVVRESEYFILVGGDESLTDIGAYNVSIDAPTLDDHANETEFLFASSIGLAVATGDGVATGVIETIGDTDLFTLSTINDGDLDITIGAPGSSIRPVITIYDQSQTQILTATDGGPNDEDGARDGSVSVTIADALKGVTYYLQIEGSNDFDANLDEFPVGAYSAIIDGPMGIIGPDLDDHADDGNFDAATAIVLSPITGDATGTGIIGEIDDTDLFTFVSLADGRAFVQLVTPSGTNHDLSVTIYGPDQTVIAFDALGVPGANASISFNVAAAGEQYYISVDAIGNGTGDYTVRIDTEPQTHFLYFPEGFSNNKIDEFVSVFNPNDSAVTYSIVLRYEDPNLPVDETILINQQTLGAGMRGGVTISQGSQGFLADGVIKNTPYAIIVTSDAPIGASLSHYDFDVATGESFTSETSDSWTFARVERVPGAVRDFLLFYNPNDHASVVSLTAYAPNGIVTLTQTVGANRRSGWDINALNELPNGIFGIVVNSEAANPADAEDHLGIVASLTHFDVTTGEGFAALGDPNGGAVVGVLPSLTQGLDTEAELVLFNPGNTTATVLITGEYVNVPNLPTLNLSYTVGAGETLALTGEDLGLINDQPIGLRYTSNVEITMQGGETRFGDANSTAGISEVAQSYFFGDAFINSKQAGVTYLEMMDFYNPADTSITITLQFNFSTGAQTETTVVVDANGFAQVRLHELDQILDQGKLNFFGIAATSDSPFAATLTHYDLFLRGGWTASGAPLGLTTQLADI